MSAFVDDRYKIHIYLDTNILVDYVERNNTLLDKSLEYLSNCPFVILRSSHYVEFEFVEVRKRNEFFNCVRGTLPVSDENMSFAKEWALDGRTYDEYKNVVTNKVEEDLKKIKEQLDIDFDDHVLHEKLIEPTKDICLSTSISREDTLVMVSCVFPKPSDKLDFGVILSNDKQYKDAFDSSKDAIENALRKKNISIPSFLNIKKLQQEDGTIINLNVQDIDVNVVSLWNWIIRQMIIKKHHNEYLGETITPPRRIEKAIAFSLHDSQLSIRDSEALIFIPKDLSQSISINKDFNYWNDNNEIKVLPYLNHDDNDYSFSTSHTTDKETLLTLKQKGNLVFYDDL